MDVLYVADAYGASDALGLGEVSGALQLVAYAYDSVFSVDSDIVYNTCESDPSMCGAMMGAYIATDAPPALTQETISLLYANSSSKIYQRNFAVDLPGSFDICDTETKLPILVDFHGYQFNLISQRYWSRWVVFQQQNEQDFILVTPDGSGDAITGPSFPLDTKGWNVLGAGGRSQPSAPGACDGTCYDWKEDYVCYLSQLDEDAAACIGNYSATCATMSAQNDAAFVEAMLQRVITKYHGDPERIYFTGQSMGGLATLDMASRMPAALKPAAIVTTSAGAMRSSTVSLGGEIPALMFHGMKDTIIPPLPWVGMSNTGEPASSLFPAAKNLSVEETVKLNPGPLDAIASKLGCANQWGEVTTVSEDGWMYDPLPRTLEGVAGVPVSLNELEWTPPEGYPDGVLCSSVPGPKAPLKFCAFDGGHCLPWQNEFCLWSTQGLFSDQDGRAYHEFVWDDFLQSGTRRRGALTPEASPVPTPSPELTPDLQAIPIDETFAALSYAGSTVNDAGNTEVVNVEGVSVTVGDVVRVGVLLG